nr:MAG TPA: hypothetical protein [Caudoviricetes sp.]DAY72984.1 MAG TPA: hypothetical protein [Caudoviricetes sp.]DAY76566.1 MAG TPA: hypothetical protein [Caudoviricetes sp.]
MYIRVRTQARDCNSIRVICQYQNANNLRRKRRNTG